MKHLVITGGVACGKSRVARQLERGYPGRAHRFDSDEANAELLRHPGNIEAIGRHFGTEVLRDGAVSRAALRERVFADPAQRAWLEQLMHPQIAALREAWLERLDADGENHSGRWTLLEIPLWYEAGLQWPADQVLVVGAAESVQRERLRRERGLDDTSIEAILASQWALERKVPRAGLVCWNDGSLATFDEQVRLVGLLLFS